jgi:AraC-like DNA-binding protein
MRRLDLFIRPCDFVARVPAGFPRSLADGSVENPSIHTSTMDSEMRRIVERIEHCPLSGTLRKVYMEGKVLELMALRLAQLSSPRPALTGPMPTAMQITRLREAREIVARNMRSPLSLKSLSREVAMSATVMKCGFRALFGETVFQYLRGLRLERARDMLARDGASAKEAAHAVGFASLSHFAKAFRERFGFSPHAWAAMERAHSRTLG